MRFEIGDKVMSTADYEGYWHRGLVGVVAGKINGLLVVDFGEHIENSISKAHNCRGFLPGKTGWLFPDMAFDNLDECPYLKLIKEEQMEFEF